jgi:hypothetical protein
VDVVGEKVERAVLDARKERPLLFYILMPFTRPP